MLPKTGPLAAMISQEIQHYGKPLRRDTSHQDSTIECAFEFFLLTFCLYGRTL